MNWHEAAEISEDNNGHLVTITSQEENDFVSALANYENAWIGLSDEESENNFEWITGEPYLFNNWASGEPNGIFIDPLNDQDWVHTNWSGNAGLWNDASFETDFLAVAELEFGCLDEYACNYSLSATIDDGSCHYDDLCGCMDPLADNYSLSLIHI